MPYPFPPDVQRLVQGQMSGGDYSSEDDLLRDALRNLAERKAAISDVLAGLDDERAGRLRSLGEVDDEHRRKYKLPPRKSAQP